MESTVSWTRNQGHERSNGNWNWQVAVRQRDRPWQCILV